MLAGGDQPVRAGQGEVVLGAVPGISEEQPGEAVRPGGGVLAWRVRGAASRRGLVRGDQGGGVQRSGEHRPEPGGVGGVLGELGGDDQPVGGGDVLGVVALEEAAAAAGISRESRSVMLRAGPGPFSAAVFRACSAALAWARSSQPRAWRTAGAWFTGTGGGRGTRGARPPGPAHRAAPAPRSGRAGRPRHVPAGPVPPGPARRPGRVRRRLSRSRRVQVGPGLRIAGGLRGLTFGFQFARALRIRSSRLPPPAPPGGRRSPRRPSPNRSSSAASAAACSPARCAASARSRSSVRFAAFDAFAVIFVPSSATVPTWPMPSRAHSISTCVNSSCARSGNAARNRAIVT